MGLPGAGKSTFYRQYLAGHVHISKDAMSRSAARDRLQRVLVSEALRAGRSAAIDNVNATRADRAWLIGQARAHGARVVGYWLDGAAADCLSRNAGRAGTSRVPPVAIYAAAKRFEPPHA